MGLKTPVEMQFAENRKRLRFEASLILDKVLNEAMEQLQKEWDAGLARGQMVKLQDAREDLFRYLKQGVLLETSALEQGTVDEV